MNSKLGLINEIISFNIEEYQNIMDLPRKGIVYKTHVMLNLMVILNICNVHFICFLETNFGERSFALYKNLRYIIKLTKHQS